MSQGLNAARLADYRWLLGPEGAKWLELAAGNGAGAGGSQTATLRLAAQLRRDLTPQRTHLVLEQADLRRRGTEKFAAAGRMFFTPLGLEQATDEAVARYKATRFGDGLVADFCCGIGGELLGLAARGPAVGIDRDEVAVLLAEANLAACNQSGSGSFFGIGGIESAQTHPPKNVPDPLAPPSGVRCGDAATEPVAGYTAWHIDPDRRPAGRRTTRVMAHEPGPDVIERLLAECGNGAVKLAPAAELPTEWRERAELEWIGRRRQCRQLVAWFGDLARSAGSRRATLLDADGQSLRIITGVPEVSPPPAERIGAYVFEPDATVLAADLCGALAAEHSLSPIAAGAVYLTADRSVDDSALACFHVLETLPLRIKSIRGWLTARNIGRVEVKKRGVDLDPRELDRQLRGPGPETATLLITRIGGKPIAIVAKRL